MSGKHFKYKQTAEVNLFYLIKVAFIESTKDLNKISTIYRKQL